jgi:hypothetical protein
MKKRMGEKDGGHRIDGPLLVKRVHARPKRCQIWNVNIWIESVPRKVKVLFSGAEQRAIKCMRITGLAIFGRGKAR